MNKNIMLPIVALMILAMAGFASAATVEEVEVRGTVQEIAGGPQGPAIPWDATNFAAFWYLL